MNRIKEFRKKAGLTQIELAKKCNIIQSTLSGYENERYEPDKETLKIMSRIFDVSIDDILGFDRSKPELRIEDVKYALSKEFYELTEDEQQDVLDFIRFKKSQRKTDL